MNRRWEESLHPRDLTGKFSHGHGGGGRGGPDIKVITRGSTGTTTHLTPLTGQFTDEQLTVRGEKVGKLAKEVSPTLSTDVTHMDGGRWSAERADVHRQIVDDLYAKAAHVPNEGKAIIAGGLGGAGKSSVLNKHAGVDKSRFLTINPDDIKEELAKRGLMPEVPGGEEFSPMERAGLVHEESSDIAKALAARAYADHKNVIWDITMSSDSSVRGRVKALKAAGYGQVDGLFVDIPVEKSVQRAMGRYKRGVNKWLKGEGHGGRYVDPRIIRAQKTSSGRTVNMDVFEGLKSGFSNWAHYDNSVDGRDPVLVANNGRIGQ
jgi:predicted ABC-type ATPase